MDEGLPTPITRPRRGRHLGGVCAGLARRWDVPAGRVRLGFAVTGLLFGLGVLVYIAAWLIFPAESVDGVTKGQRGIVLLAQLCGALLGLATLSAAGTAATLFGFGWVVVALAGAILVGTLAGWAKLGPSWALLPIGALVLPSAALAVGGVQVDPSTSSVTYTPRASSEIDDRTYKSGLGLLTLDLRKTQLPESGTVDIKVRAGVRRTLIALPHDQCVRVRVVAHDVPNLLQLGGLLAGRGTTATPSPVLFNGPGRVVDDQPPTAITFTGPEDPVRPGPTLAIDYETAGGELVVRDYPDDVEPRSYPDWPGYPVYVEERPDTTGLTKSEARRLVREWRVRRDEQIKDKARVDRDMNGPCAIPAEPAAKKKRKRTR